VMKAANGVKLVMRFSCKWTPAINEALRRYQLRGALGCEEPRPWLAPIMRSLLLHCFVPIPTDLTLR
jgi:hypothetical protein